MSLAKQQQIKDFRMNAQLIVAAQAALMGTLTDAFESATFDTGTYGARQHIKTLSLKELRIYISEMQSTQQSLLNSMGGSGIVKFSQDRYAR